MAFEKLSLHPKILKALAKAGYQTPTKIQQEAIPKVLEGCDLRASAQTGTGKTAAFLLPALHRLCKDSKKWKGPRILILVPTRELAMQVTEQAVKYSKFIQRVKSVCVVGGVPYPKQIRNLSRPYDLLIATPGRLIDFIDRGKINFSQLEMLVLDEADRMLDMGFLEPVEQIVAATPSSRQTLLFSATLEGTVFKLSERLLNEPQEVRVQAKGERCDHIQQVIHFADDLKHKNRLLTHILNETQQTIVFTSTKRHADQLARDLKDQDFRAAALHGDMNQRKRSQTILKLKTGKVRVLVATDVAARGIDVQSITHVINFDLPHNVEDYVHRIGRTGRAGAEGTALSLVSGRDGALVKKIESFTKQKIDVVEIPGLEPSPKKKRFSEPKKKRSRFQRGPKKGFKARSKTRKAKR